MNFDVFDFIDYPKLVRTYTFEPIDIDLIFSSRPTTDKKE